MDGLSLAGNLQAEAEQIYVGNVVVWVSCTEQRTGLEILQDSFQLYYSILFSCLDVSICSFQIAPISIALHAMEANWQHSDFPPNQSYSIGSPFQTTVSSFGYWQITRYSYPVRNMPPKLQFGAMPEFPAPG